MAEFELKPTPGDRRLYALEGVGTLRLAGAYSGTTTGTTAEGTWSITSRGFFGGVIQATDAAGTTVGEFEPSHLRRGGTLRWADRELTLRRTRFWRQRYALADGDRKVAILDGRGWLRWPVKVTVDDPVAVEPGLLLFAAFVIHNGLAEHVGGG